MMTVAVVLEIGEVGGRVLVTPVVLAGDVGGRVLVTFPVELEVAVAGEDVGGRVLVTPVELVAVLVSG